MPGALARTPRATGPARATGCERGGRIHRAFVAAKDGDDFSDEVLQLLADGLTGEAIGHRPGISPRTAHSHLARLYRKLGVSDRMRAVLIGEAASPITVDRALPG